MHSWGTGAEGAEHGMGCVAWDAWHGMHGMGCIAWHGMAWHGMHGSGQGAGMHV